MQNFMKLIHRLSYMIMQIREGEDENQILN